MRKMKDSGIAWIGEIPDEWKINRGKNILELLKRDPLDNCGVVTCFRDGQVTLRSNRREEGFTFADKEIGYQGICVGDLVIHGMDGFAGAIGISDSSGKGSPVLSVCKSKRENHLFYVMYFLRMLAQQDLFLALATGIRERSCDLRWNKIAELCFPSPSCTEQQRISNYLDSKCASIDRIIEKQRTVIEKLKAYKQSVITEAVTKGLNPDVPMKDSGIEWIGEIPEGWQALKLKYIAKIKSGDSITNEKLTEEGKIEVFGGNGLMGFCNFTNVDYECFVIGRVGALCGNVRHVTTPKFVTDNALILWATCPISYRFYYYALYAANLGSLNTSNAQPLITGTKVLNCFIPFTDLSEQQQIADYLDQKCTEIYKLITAKESIIKKLTSYKQSLIYEAVTGKMEI